MYSPRIVRLGYSWDTTRKSLISLLSRLAEPFHFVRSKSNIQNVHIASRLYVRVLPYICLQPSIPDFFKALWQRISSTYVNQKWCSIQNVINGAGESISKVHPSDVRTTWKSSSFVMWAYQAITCKLSQFGKIDLITIRSAFTVEIDAANVRPCVLLKEWRFWFLKNPLYFLPTYLTCEILENLGPWKVLENERESISTTLIKFSSKFFYVWNSNWILEFLKKGL